MSAFLRLALGTTLLTATSIACSSSVGGLSPTERKDANADDAAVLDGSEPPSSHDGDAQANDGGGEAGAPGMAPILVAAGDIAACGKDGSGEPTAKLLDALFEGGAHADGVVVTLGDNAYEDGTIAQYTACYQPSWGRHKARTRPSPGNHEYHTPGGAGYYAYFGAAAGPAGRGYYSFDVGAWHVVSLNTEISVSSGSPQLEWLRADLATSTTKCTLAYWHQSRYSSAVEHGSSTSFTALWQALYDKGVDVVLSAHDHDYERFAPQDAHAGLDVARGIREFVVGTGGDTTYPFAAAEPNSEVRYGGGYGVLQLTLHATSFDWAFLSEAGKSFTDVGTGTCH